MLLSTIFKAIESYRKYLYLAIGVIFLILFSYVVKVKRDLETLEVKYKSVSTEKEQLKSQLDREKQLNTELLQVQTSYIKESMKASSEMISILKGLEKDEDTVLKEYDVKPSDYTAQEKPWEKKISQHRISTIWQSYCIQHPEHEKCKKENK